MDTVNYSYRLPVGILLDDRYQIKDIVGEGGFGITYEATNILTKKKVAIKELFWRGHIFRDSEKSLSAVLYADNDNAEYETLKKNFIKEAKILRDFNNESGIVSVLDYFEENNTVYMVMEFLEGLTLRDYLKTKGTFDAEKLLIKTLPLLESLSHIHQGGIIHRDISPDNIMVLNDGSFCLIDFGAARNFNLSEARQYTTIANDSYAPPEQYDKNGLQGPWTDIYALSATMYQAVTGHAPESSMQRTFLDELKTISDYGVKIKKEYESIILKGLSLSANKRYQSADEMSKAILEVLPERIEERKRTKRIIAIVVSAVVAVAIAVGIILYVDYDKTHKFRNVETETFRLNAPDGISDTDFSENLSNIENTLNNFAGKDNFILTVDNNRITITLPLSCFDNTVEISTAIIENFGPAVEGFDYTFNYEIKAVWEDADSSITPGELQCNINELPETTIIQVYSPPDFSEEMTKGEWSNFITDIKTRLDSLGNIYSFGTLYGNSKKIVIRTSPDRIGEFINDTLAKDVTFYAVNESNYYDHITTFTHDLYCEFSPVSNENGGYNLAVVKTSEYDQEKIKGATTDLLKSGKNTIYLYDYSTYICSMTINEPITDGSFVFDHFYFENMESITEESKFLVDYLSVLINDTDLPSTYYLDNQCIMKGNSQLFDEDESLYYGINSIDTKFLIESENVINQMSADGIDVAYDKDNKTCWISFGLPISENIVENGIEQTETLIKKYNLDEIYGTIIFRLADEQGDNRSRLILAPSSNSDIKKISLAIFGEDFEDCFDNAEITWNGYTPSKAAKGDATIGDKYIEGNN